MLVESASRSERGVQGITEVEDATAPGRGAHHGSVPRGVATPPFRSSWVGPTHDQGGGSRDHTATHHGRAHTPEVDQCLNWYKTGLRLGGSLWWDSVLGSALALAYSVYGWGDALWQGESFLEVEVVLHKILASLAGLSWREPVKQAEGWLRLGSFGHG